MAMISTIEAERHRRLDPLLERWIKLPLTRCGRPVAPGLGLDAPCISQLSTKHPAVTRLVALRGFPLDKVNPNSAIMARIGRLVDRWSDDSGDGCILRWK
eukprot:4508586-Alexandrium_andersonii.AAC.1